MILKKVATIPYSFKQREELIEIYSLLAIPSMSCFNIQIKPHKSWKNISTGLRSKLRKLRNSTNHVVATTRRLTSRTHRRNSSNRSYRELESNRFMALYVDQLYAAARHGHVTCAREATKPRSRAATTSSSSSIGNINHGKRVMVKPEGSSSVATHSRSAKYETVDDAWKAIVAKSPLLRVDERAEEFINKFKKDMMLQKEKSLMDYHDMIARGV